MAKNRMVLGTLAVAVATAWLYHMQPWVAGSAPSLEAEVLPPAQVQDRELPVVDRSGRESISGVPTTTVEKNPKPLTVRCRDVESLPLEGAEIHFSDGGPWTRMGVTNKKGDLVWHWPQERAANSRYELAASRPGFATRELVAKGNETSLEFVLEPGGYIEGIVVGTYGSTPPQVFVTPGDDTWLSSKVRAFDLGNPRYTSIDPDAGGRFAVRGLELGATYQFHAVGAGGLSAIPSSAQAGTLKAPGQVEVAWAMLYGSEVIFTGPGGESLHGENNAVRGGTGRSHGPQAAADSRLLYPNSAFAVNMAMGHPFGFEDGSFVWRPTLYDSRPGEGLLTRPELPFEFQLEGYELFHGTLELREMSAGYQQQRFELTPWTSTWGRVEVELLGLEYLAGVSAAEHEIMRFVVFLEGDDATWKRAFRAPLRSPLILDDVPAGKYNIRLGTHGGTLDLGAESGPVSVGEETAHTTIDLGLTGSLELRLFDGTTTVSPRKINYSLVGGSGSRVGDWESYFSPGPPYIAHHIPEGLYYVWLDIPWSVGYFDPGATPRNSFFIHGGTTSVVDLFKPDPGSALVPDEETGD